MTATAPPASASCHHWRLRGGLRIAARDLSVCPLLCVAISAPRPGGGSVWESNPPPTCLEPDTGFEVREAHRDPIRLREANYPSDQQKESTTMRRMHALLSPDSSKM